VTAVTPTVYVRGGGTEALGGFNSTTQSYAPDRQTLAVLVRTSNDTYERRFSDGSKEVFGQPDGSSFSPRRVFLTSVIDRVGNATTLSYDASFRVTVITDPLGQSTTLSYDLANDALKITKVTDPFGRSAIFEYTSSKLTRITDPIGIQSAFNYATGSDFINSMTTPYGTTTFASGESGNSVRWIEVTDPRGGRERVEYNSAAPNIASTEPSAPPGVYNTSLQFRNSFYWDKKAMADAPGDYTKAELFHWLITPEGKISAIKHSEKKPLENRVWYIYAEQSDPGKVGRTAQPIDVARVVDGGGVQLFQYNYNPLGNLVKETDPVGRVKTYVYDGNNIDLLEVYQRNPNGSSLDPDGQHADRIASFTYNSLHEPLTEMDAAGQVMRSSYNSAGQILTRTNPRNEMTTYTYEGIAPLGYLHSITGPSFNGSSAVTSFTYDPYRRIQTIINEADEATVSIEYDNLDRRTKIIYSDNTYEQFHYTDTDAGIMTLDLTESRDRTGKWTYRHYDSNRKLESITDPLGHTTRYGWCVCGALTSITDPNRNVTTFNRDLQGRVYQKVFSDSATVDYLFEGQNGPNTAGATSRLKSATDALNRRTNYSYFNDDRISQIYYTDSSGNPLNPPTHSVEYTYDISYNRIESMADETGITTYSYYPIGSSPTLGAGRLATIDGPLGDEPIG
jgi:YD repeat-containing protein